MTLLAVDDVARSFGAVAAVAGVSLTVAAGQRVALIGPNGAGKTTCFNIINGQLRPDRGRVLLADQDVTGMAPRGLARRGVGRTFQISQTFPSLTVRENVQMALAAHRGQSAGVGRALRHHDPAAADAALAQVGLAADGDRGAGALAYGDAKRLELAMVLAQAPRLLLMDEPTAGMAADERHALMDLVSDLARGQGIGLLFTEHDMDVVFGHADRIVVLDRGRVIAAGEPDAVRHDETVRRVYLGLEAEA
ncbi:amino acid/amide ABC transporter ATP-binding protein 1 (HAAT family) [Stella humosa]|uniref:Amino acid/amide ABC transporter ATP-binding protein 1 (HAAT family) n=1 Tax=Stella humosa TaxID=94 RepID=A0A3N1MFM1_9PROT|nr:ABC transporter ATP-binding protein [Stella humosa]ROQ01527.1 amino acid/amide ABC transporter ATP-binding protein 1 (HAAT family) [Stella humosa]BBK31906.1 ABC transporter ATP-binding protein [Stella humosa]